MPEKIFFLDSDKNFTTLEKARWVVVREETVSGELVTERWLDGRTTRERK